MQAMLWNFAKSTLMSDNEQMFVRYCITGHFLTEQTLASQQIIELKDQSKLQAFNGHSHPLPSDTPNTSVHSTSEHCCVLLEPKIYHANNSFLFLQISSQNQRKYPSNCTGAKTRTRTQTSQKFGVETTLGARVRKYPWAAPQICTKHQLWFVAKSARIADARTRKFISVKIWTFFSFRELGEFYASSANIGCVGIWYR